MLSVNQKARVIQPIIPATIAPSLAPLITKYIEKAIPKYQKPLRSNQLA
jgi:hypothetical protein